MATASKFVNMAKSYIGYSEANGKYKTIINGYNNHKPLPEGYAVKYSDEWCATFVSFIAIKAGCTDIVLKECSCERMINLYKNIGRFITNKTITPRMGDIIFYDWQNNGWADHVGIVEKVEGDTIHVIEGNFNSEVKRRLIKVNNKYICGYARPNYEAEVQTVPKPSKSNSEVAKEVLKGIWGTGSERKQRLTEAGYNYDEVQKLVNDFLKPSEKKKTKEELAIEVIKGLWGSGSERKKRLTEAGYNYNEVQKLVNKKLS